MKKYIALTFAALCAVAVSCVNSPKTFNVNVLDAWANLGEIDEADGPVSFKVVYVNDAEDTVYIFRTSVSCSCLTVEDIENNCAAPGEKIVTSFRYDPAYRNGETEEYAILRLSSREDVTVHLTADVKPCVHPIEEGQPYDLGEGLHTSHKVLAYANAEPGKTQDMYIHIANGKTKKANIVLEPRGEYSECIRFRQPGKMAADGRDTIHFKMTLPEDYVSEETLEFVLQPVVDGVETETPLTVRIFPETPEAEK